MDWCGICCRVMPSSPFTSTTTQEQKSESFGVVCLSGCYILYPVWVVRIYMERCLGQIADIDHNDSLQQSRL